MRPKGERAATQRWSVAMRRAVSGSRSSLTGKTFLLGPCFPSWIRLGCRERSSWNCFERRRRRPPPVESQDFSGGAPRILPAMVSAPYALAGDRVGAEFAAYCRPGPRRIPYAHGVIGQQDRALVALDGGENPPNPGADYKWFPAQRTPMSRCAVSGVAHRRSDTRTCSGRL